MPCLQTNLWDKYDILPFRYGSSGVSTVKQTLFISLYGLISLKYFSKIQHATVH